LREGASGGERHDEGDGGKGPGCGRHGRSLADLPSGARTSRPGQRRLRRGMWGSLPLVAHVGICGGSVVEMVLRARLQVLRFAQDDNSLNQVTP
jgi:hypothetical protein